jgi:hypothetical protein
MKKHYLFTLLAMLIVISVSAQKFRSGIKGGFNYSTLNIDAVEDRKMRPGFHGGFLGKHP